MICYCNCCAYLFESDVLPQSKSHDKTWVPKRCPRCREQVWVNEAGKKVPAVRPATEKERKAYYRGQHEIIEKMWQDLESSGGPVQKLEEYLEESQYTVAVTGAGISYLYGMRRFKQVAGEGDWMRKVTPEYIKSHPDEVYALWKDAFLDAIFEKGPGPVHVQLVELEKLGMLQGIVTQNLDYLHELAGSGNVAAFMGSFADVVCLDCKERAHDITVWRHGTMPCCPKCGGYMVPVYFSRFAQRFGSGQNAPDEFMARAQDMIARAELLLVIGTTGFHSDEYLSKLRPSTRMVQINPNRTRFDRMADVNIRMDAEEVLEQILSDE